MQQNLSEISHAWIAQAVSGDKPAVERIVRALERPVYAVALRMLHDARDAEDATQEALIRVVTRLSQFRGESRFSTWALRIAIHRIVDYRRERGARATFEQFSADLLDEGLDRTAPERPEDAVLLRQLRQLCTRAMLQCLDVDHRIAFVLGEVLELDSNEAAEILDIEPAAFRKRLSRARYALTEFLQQHCSVVEAEAPCACHRRLKHAHAKGRVAIERPTAPSADVRDQRRSLQMLPVAERAGALYRDPAELQSAPDFVVKLHALLTHFLD